jgi:hypothetical protein
MRSWAVRPSNAALAERRSLTRIYRWGLLVRASVGILAYALTIYLDLPIVEDAKFYEESGYELAQNWIAGTEIDLGELGGGAITGRYLVIGIALFYFVMGGLRALPLLLIAYSAITALVPLYVYRVARELQAPEAAARRAGWLVSLSPCFVFWSGSLYKEGLALLILSVAAYHTLLLLSRWNRRSLVILVLCDAALWGVRTYLAILLGLAVSVSLLWGRLAWTGRFLSVPVVVRHAAVLAAFSLVILYVGVTLRTDEVLLESEEGFLVELDVRRGGSATEARSGYLQEASIATPAEALGYFPLGLFYFLTVPWPWQVGAFRQNLIIPETAFWLALYPLMVIGIRRAFKGNQPGTVFLLVLTGGTCAIYALLSANVGTTYRMRSQVWLLWAPFAAWGWEVWRERRRQARQGRWVRGRSRALATRAR